MSRTARPEQEEYRVLHSHNIWKKCALSPAGALCFLLILVFLLAPAAQAQGPDAPPMGPAERWSKVPTRKLSEPISLDDPVTDAQPLLKAPGLDDEPKAEPPKAEAAPDEAAKPAQDTPAKDAQAKDAKTKDKKGKDKKGKKDKVQNRKDRPEPSKAKPEAKADPPLDEAAKPVLEYYLKVWTLDESFPELFARGPREHETQAFGKLVAMQKGRGIYDHFRKAYVDTKGLTIRLVSKSEDKAKVRVTGTLVVYVAGLTEEEEEGDDFTLIPEDGKWKILERVEAP